MNITNNYSIKHRTFFDDNNLASSNKKSETHSCYAPQGSPYSADRISLSNFSTIKQKNEESFFDKFTSFVENAVEKFGNFFGNITNTGEFDSKRITQLKKEIESARKSPEGLSFVSGYLINNGVDSWSVFYSELGTTKKEIRALVKKGYFLEAKKELKEARKSEKGLMKESSISLYLLHGGSLKEIGTSKKEMEQLYEKTMKYLRSF